MACTVSTSKNENSTEKKTSEVASEETAKPSSGKYDKHLEIVYIGTVAPRGVPNPETDDLKEFIEEKFNITIKKVNIDFYNTDQLKLYFAEGNTADVIYTRMGRSLLADQGLIRPISEESLRTLMPTFIRNIEELVGEELVKSQLYYKGKVWGVPYIDINYAMPWISVIREDWLNNVGINKIPETLDELYVALKKFAHEDPDGNGKDDTFGMGMAGTSVAGCAYIRGAFGMSPQSYYQKDGKVIATSISDEYRDYLKLMNLWYKEGIIDPEFVTDDWVKYLNKWYAGRYGMFDCRVSNIVSTLAVENSVIKNLQKNIPSAKPVMFGPVKNSNGQFAAYIDYPDIYAYYPFYFGNNTSDEKVERILAMKEEIAANKDLYIRLTYGEEGVHYDLENGVIIRKTYWETVDDQAKAALQYYAWIPMTLELVKYVTPPEDLKLYEYALSLPKVYGGVTFPVSRVNEARRTYGTDLTKIENEFYLNAITGKIDIDAEWENYKKEWLDIGGAKVIEEYEQILSGK